MVKVHKKFFILFFIFLAVVSFVNAACTISLDKESYFGGETATATMSCSLGSEKNEAYTVVWNNGTSVVETDTGTTPNVVSQSFFETLDIPLGQNWTSANVSLTLTSLEGFDTFTVVETAGASSLIIKNVTITSDLELFIGKIFGIRAIVEDENGKKINNANCQFDLEDGSELPIIGGSDIAHNGFAQKDFNLNLNAFDEGRDYIVRASCFCGASGTSSSCFDEDGNEISNSVGTGTNFFTTQTYLSVNTITDKSTYDLRDYIHICVNVSNLDYPNRIPLEIDHQVRCSRGEDNNDDLDRSILFSDGESYDHRGINSNTTQMQCKRFIIPEIREYEGTFSSCYASSNVWVISEGGERILVYPTTSPLFYINSTELNLKVDWEQVSNLTYNSIINLSDDSFEDWNGTNIGNIDIRLISPDEILDPNIRKLIQGVDLDRFIVSKYIKSISVLNYNNESVPSYLEFPDDGNLELELRNQNLNQSGWYNVTLVFHDYEERQALALEGIENKTGTFHLAVECPSQPNLGSDMDCNITAQVEDQTISQKEVDFTCYIYDGSSEYSALNFNQMINKTLQTFEKTFLVPSSFVPGNSYVLQCHADYYNFGSRRDSFYDTFFIPSEGSSSGSSGSSGGNFLNGNAILEAGENNSGDNNLGENNGEGFAPFDFDGDGEFSKFAIIFAICLFALISILIFIDKKKKRRNPHSKTNSKKILRIAITIFTLFVLLTIIFLLIHFLGNAEPAREIPKTQFFSDRLVRGIIITTFVVLMILVLFKSLNIRATFQINFPRGYENSSSKKISRLQDKINEEILRKELTNHKRNFS
ncbi:MAG: hypothetical protein KC516_03740 [Nanoarchaeota archaeon]|nr:hypothetical protein [Nanoarchaeota archaeon]